MTTIEDELRALLDRASAEPVLPDGGRTASVHCRIRRRRRAHRVLGGSAAVILVALAGGTVALAERPDAHHAPTASTTNLTNAGPGRLPQYFAGGKLTVGDTVTLPGDGLLSVQYTPVTWNFTIDITCALPDTMWLEVYLNGHKVFGQGCSPDNTLDATSAIDDPARFGVALGEPLTFTGTVGPDPLKKNAPAVSPTDVAGVVSLGIYDNVTDWNSYPHPAPTAVTDTSRMLVAADLPHLLCTVSGATAEVRRNVTLGKQIQLTAITSNPGVLDFALNGVRFGTYGTWDGPGTLMGDTLTVGQGVLAGFHPGETVEFTITPSHFPPGNQWTANLYGS